MKRTIIGLVLSVVFIGVVILFGGCGISKPNLKKDYIGLSEIEKRMHYRFDKCGYMQQFTTADLRCADLELGNRKINNILDFGSMKKENQLPKLYNQKGEYEMTFDDFFKYVR